MQQVLCILCVLCLDTQQQEMYLKPKNTQKKTRKITMWFWQSVWCVWGAGGLGSIPKPLAKSIAHMLSCNIGAAAPLKSDPRLAMVMEESDEEENWGVWSIIKAAGNFLRVRMFIWHKHNNLCELTCLTVATRPTISHDDSYTQLLFTLHRLRDAGHWHDLQSADTSWWMVTYSDTDMEPFRQVESMQWQCLQAEAMWGNHLSALQQRVSVQ